MLGGSSSRSQGGGLLEAGAAEPGRRRRIARLLLECLGNFCKNPKTKIKVGQLANLEG